MKKPDMHAVISLLEQQEWGRAHTLVQEDEESTLSCWAHGIVHIMEGDLSNARYWYGRAKRAFPKDYSVPSEIAALKDACS